MTAIERPRRARPGRHPLALHAHARACWSGIAPGHAKPIDLTVGDPREAMPAFVPDRLGEAKRAVRQLSQDPRRPTICATPSPPGSAGATASPARSIATREILPVSGSREGLFFAAHAGRRPQARRGPAGHAHRQPVLSGLSGRAPTPPTASRSSSTRPPRPATCPISTRSSASRTCCARTAAFYLCSPANPQGAVADAAYIRKALALARQHDFMLFFDECYSEIYTRRAARRRA